MCLRSGRPQEATGRQTLSIQGWRREKAGRPARVPGLVTADGPGNPRPHTLAEMAGGEDRRVVGTLHLLLATVLSLIAGNLSQVSAAWTQEKVRGGCCVLYLSDCWSVPRPGTWPPSPGLAGGGSGMLSPCPGTKSSLSSWEANALSPKSGRQGWSRGCAGVAWGLGDVTGLLWLRSDGDADRLRKCVSLAVEEQGHRGATAQSRPREALARSWVPRLCAQGCPEYPQLLNSRMLHRD